MLKVNEEFERDYDNGEYEAKIAGVIRRIENRQDRTQDEMDTWNKAVLKLSGEDHYLLVLIDLAGRRSSEPSSWNRWLPSMNPHGTKRPRGDVFRLILTAIVLCAILLVLMALRAILFR